MKLNDIIFDGSGYLKIELLDKNDNVIFKFEKANKLIDATVNKIADYICGISPDTVDLNLMSLRFGTGGIDANGDPLPIDGTETGLKEPAREYKWNTVPGNLISDVSGLPTNSTISITKAEWSYTYLCNFSQEDANEKDTNGPLNISEMGLFNKAGDMLSYRTFPIVAKDSNSKMRVTYTLNWFRNREN